MFVAYEGGPRAALEPIARELSGTLQSTESHFCESEAHWNAILNRQRSTLLFVGTSDSKRGAAVEVAARRAASRLGTPCVCVEDFPGNYRGIAGCREALLVADGDYSLDLARRRDSESFANGIALAGLRYDPLRHDGLITPASAVGPALWVGQPETDLSLATLQRIVPVLHDLRVDLMFRAHPRDPGYRTGVYSKVLTDGGMNFEDVTGLGWSDCLRKSPSLVLTQYSSLAVEAGFYGIPSVNVLYSDLGESHLIATKGYAAPPWCEAGAALLIRDRGAESRVLENARDPEVRTDILSAFANFFRIAERQVPTLLYRLYNHRLN